MKVSNIRNFLVASISCALHEGVLFGADYKAKPLKRQKAISYSNKNMEPADLVSNF